MVDMVEKYKKLDSFINFTGKFKSDREIVLSEIASFFSKANEYPALSNYEQTILDQIYMDLFIKNNDGKNKRFSISDNSTSSSNPDIISPKQFIFENPLYSILGESNCALIALTKHKIKSVFFTKLKIKKSRFW